jgi:PAS domain S-box-containing protein
MSPFRDAPIKQKLLAIMMMTTAAALLLAGAGILVADSIFFRGYLERDLAALAQIIGDNSTASLAFDDARSARETLAALRARPHLITACIYRADGSLLARYLRPGAVAACPAAGAREELRFSGGNVLLSHPIVLGRRLGTLVILYDHSEVYERISLYGTTVLGLLLVSILLVFLLSSRLRAIIVTPISQLADVAGAVSASRDYSIRARKFSNDELGILVDAFNEMLAGIQSRDNNLKRALLEREEALRETQDTRESLETTLASIGDAVISTDVDGRIIFANPVAHGMLRCRELAGRNLDEVVRILNELTRARVESPVQKVLREGAIVESGNHTILVAQDGTEIPIDDSGAPIRGKGGRILGTVLVFRDVTARRAAEATGKLLASIVESSHDAILGIDLHGIITSWNRGAERIFGFSAEESIGKDASLIAPPGRPDDMPAILVRVGKGESIAQYQALRLTKSGQIIDVSITVSPLRDSLGRIVGASKIARDISEQVRTVERLAQLNADLQRSNENLRRSNEDLERFAFVASHDLQEPLRMISVYSQLLLRTHRGEFDQQAQTYVDNVVGSTKRMRELLADLLAYAEIGARVDEPVEAVDLNHVVENVIQNLQAAIDDNQAAITVDPLPTLRAFQGHFIPLFQNLIGNSIKYRSERPPRVQVAFEKCDNQLRFSVADNGIGIAPEYHQKIFGPFKRLHGKDIEGTGIGLAICQRVVERYGGRIWVESQDGQGSTFIFTLPAVLTAVEEICNEGSHPGDRG